MILLLGGSGYVGQAFQHFLTFKERFKGILGD